MSSKEGPATLGLTEEQILKLAQHSDTIIAAAAEITARRRAGNEKDIVEHLQAGRRRMAGKKYSTGVAWFDELDDEGQMREIAAANLKAYGAIVPPIEERLSALSKKCPGCGKTKSVMRGFGVRFYKGVPRAQSHCTQCRRDGDEHRRNDER